MLKATTSPAANLRILREYAGLTLAQVAEAAGTSESWLSKIETGKRPASKEFIGRVAGVIADGTKGK
jgi:transcriptional regulator with XRE-family HTH domain